MLIKSVKQQAELNASIDYITTYIDQKYNELLNYVDTINTRYDYIAQKIDDIYTGIGQINDKITEDMVDRLNNLGTIEDFQTGFYEGLKGE